MKNNLTPLATMFFFLVPQAGCGSQTAALSHATISTTSLPVENVGFFLDPQQAQAFIHPVAALSLSYTVDNAMVDYLKDRHMDASISMSAADLVNPLARAGARLSSRRYRFSWRGQEICQADLQLHGLPDHSVFVGGVMPPLGSLEVSGLEATQDAAIIAVRSQLEQQGVLRERLSILEAKPCWFMLGDGNVTSAWQFKVEADGYPYKIVAGREAFQSIPLFLSEGNSLLKPETIGEAAFRRGALATGTSRVFVRNANGPMADFRFPLNGDGTLTNDKVVTGTGQVARAQDANNRFIYDPTDMRFAEASLFTNAMRTLTWHESRGFDSHGELVQVAVHAEFGGDVNNALFKPGNNVTTHDQILIGDGDGHLLQNLSTDADVIFHEFSHRVLYRKMTEIMGDTLVLHEGIADFMTTAQTGDPCLGRSVCPAGSPICQVSTDQCLRSADNSLVFDEAAPAEAHRKGMIVSGFLWDLYTKHNFALAKVTDLLYGAIPFLLPSTRYQDFIAALYASDRLSFGGEFHDAITDAAIARKFPLPLTILEAH